MNFVLIIVVAVLQCPSIQSQELRFSDLHSVTDNDLTDLDEGKVYSYPWEGW